MIDQGDDAADGTAGEDAPWSFVYIPETATNLIAGRIDDDATVLDSVGSFSVIPRPTTGEYLLQISDGMGGFLGKDDGVLLLNVTKDVAPVFAGADDNFLLQEYSIADEGFIISSHDLAAASDQTTEWSFAFLQFDAPPALIVPEPNTAALVAMGVLLMVGRRRRRR
ncbi:MAG: PEP-CTERM sorting domain-containing protein [Planctomycetales bacterium]|nr:PEP-CTERM sorting domain-containing protein [Planctomycetales bacterium]